MDILGNGINVIIEAEATPIHDWMAFSCWYSLTKNLPDATVGIRFNSRDNHNLFQWVKRLKIPRYFANHEGLSFEPSVVMVRELTKVHLELLQENFNIVNNYLLCDAKVDNIVPFVSFSNGCGAFVTSNWINSMDYPFPWAERFMTSTSTTNEVRILKLWKQLSPLYTTVSRG